MEPMESGAAYSEDPRGEQIGSVRVDIAAPLEGSLLIPRRGPIGVGHGFSPDALRTIRDRVLEVERELGEPASVQWRRYDENIDTFDPRRINAPLRWGGQHLRARLSDIWSRANAGEIMPDVITPFSWSIVAEALESGFHVPWAERSRGRRFVEVFDGYMYFNIGLINELIENIGMPGSYFQEAIGGPEPPFTPRRKMDYLRIARSIRHYLVRIAADQRLLRQWPGQRAAARGEAGRLTELLAVLDGGGEIDDRELLRHLSASAIFSARFVDYLLDVQTSAFGLVQFLLLLTDRWIGDREAALPLIQGLPGVSTAEGDLALWRIAERTAADAEARRAVERLDAEALADAVRGDGGAPAWLADELRAFLDQYGHRAAGELELAQPRWAEDPALILGTFREYALHPEQSGAAALSTRQQDARARAERDVERRLRGGPLGGLLPIKWWMFRAMMVMTQRMTPLRENPKFELLRISLQQRRLWLRLGRRWSDRGMIDQPEDVFFLIISELTTLARRGDDPVIQGQMRSRIRRRRRQYDAWSRAEPPLLRDRNGAPIGIAEEPAAPDGALAGIGASPGSAQGRVRIARTAAEGRELQAGEVLVAQFTDPGWTPIFPLAAAVVTEIGGMLSHGAVVAREFGIPAVVNVPRATERLRDGQRIEVDGGSGRVRVLDEDGASG